MKKPIVEFPVETTSLNDVFPIGFPIYWPSKTLPNGRFVWVHGQEFDRAANPKLAVLYPSGFLPDPRWDYFRCVGTDQEALTKQEQSVQPLGFKGIEMDPHIHSVTMNGGNNGGGGGFYMSFSRQWTQVAKSTSVSAGTPAGDITGTGTETKPQTMLWHCIMRIN